MIRVVPGYDEQVIAWCQERGWGFTPPVTTFALVDEETGGIVGAAVFNDYNRSNIELSVVTERPQPFPKGVFRAVLHYPFIQLGCRRVTAKTRKGDHRARRLIRRLGFKPEGEMVDYYPDTEAAEADNAMVYGMTRDQCRWV